MSERTLLSQEERRAGMLALREQNPRLCEALCVAGGWRCLRGAYDELVAVGPDSFTLKTPDGVEVGACVEGDEFVVRSGEVEVRTAKVRELVGVLLRFLQKKRGG